MPTTKCFDYVENEYVAIDAYLRADADNAVFMTDKQATCSSLTRLTQLANDAESFFYECSGGNYLGPYVKLDFEYIVIVPLLNLRMAISSSKRGVRLLHLQPTNIMLQKTASFDVVLQRNGSYVGGHHCQAGTDKRVYVLGNRVLSGIFWVNAQKDAHVKTVFNRMNVFSLSAAQLALAPPVAYRSISPSSSAYSSPASSPSSSPSSRVQELSPTRIVALLRGRQLFERVTRELDRRRDLTLTRTPEGNYVYQ